MEAPERGWGQDWGHPSRAGDIPSALGTPHRDWGHHVSFGDTALGAGSSWWGGCPAPPGGQGGVLGCPQRCPGVPVPRRCHHCPVLVRDVRSRSRRRGRKKEEQGQHQGQLCARGLRARLSFSIGPSLPQALSEEPEYSCAGAAASSLSPPGALHPPLPQGHPRAVPAVSPGCPRGVPGARRFLAAWPALGQGQARATRAVSRSQEP